MKQSSIEWLMEIDKSRAITIEEWQQAKAMHKKEIIDAFISGDNSDFLQEQEEKLFAELYYKETFNTKEK